MGKTMNKSNELKYKLLKPLTFGEKEINEVVVKEPTYKVLKSCDLTKGQEVINTIIEKCSNLNEDLLDDLSSKDYFNIIEMISDSDFLG